MAFRFSPASWALPPGKFSRTPDRLAPATGGRRLLRSQAETFRFFFHDPAYASALPRLTETYPHRYRGELLRSLHGERCLHARLRPHHSVGLYGVEYGGRKSPGARAHEEIPEGGHT